MTYHVEFSVRALDDLETLYFDKNVSESQAAARWFNGLQVAIEALANLPRRNPIAAESKSYKRELRNLLYGNKPHVYRVIYEVNEDRQIVKVFHIRHGARESVQSSELI